MGTYSYVRYSVSFAIARVILADVCASTCSRHRQSVSWGCHFGYKYSDCDRVLGLFFLFSFFVIFGYRSACRARPLNGCIMLHLPRVLHRVRGNGTCDTNLSLCCEYVSRVSTLLVDVPACTHEWSRAYEAWYEPCPRRRRLHSIPYASPCPWHFPFSAVMSTWPIQPQGQFQSRFMIPVLHTGNW